MSSESAQAARTRAVIVNYNAGPYLRQSVDALLASAQPVDICVVDNASLDGSLAALPSQVSVLTNNQNEGFPRACNQGAAESHHDFLLFINPDCFVAPDTLGKLIQALDRGSNFALVGARILGTDGAEQRACRRRLPTVTRTLMTFSGLERFENRWPVLRGINMYTPIGTAAAQPVGAVSGALMLVRRADFDAVGGFDESYFLHCEDLDLCQRLTDNGRLIGFVPEAEAVHVKGVTQRRSPWRSEWLKHRNMLRFVRKFALAGTLGRTVLAIAIWLRFALLTPVLAWRQVRPHPDV